MYIYTLITFCSNLGHCLLLFYYAIGIKCGLSYLSWCNPSLRLSLFSGLIENITLTKPLYQRENGFVLLIRNCSHQTKIELSPEIILELLSTNSNMQNQDSCCPVVWNMPCTGILSYFKQCRKYLFARGGMLLHCLMEVHSWGCILHYRWSGKAKWVVAGFALLARRMNLFRMNSHVKPVSLAGGRMLTWQVGTRPSKHVPILQGTCRMMWGGE